MSVPTTQPNQSSTTAQPLTADLNIVSSIDEAAATCVVCGNDIVAGEGITARYEGQLLRFKCSGCATRFSSDPERYLARGPAGCCGGHKEHSPPSEWMSD